MAIMSRRRRIIRIRSKGAVWDIDKVNEENNILVVALS